jgi:hypothetical protein
VVNAMARLDIDLRRKVAERSAQALIANTADRLIQRILDPAMTREQIEHEFAVIAPHVEQLRARDERPAEQQPEATEPEVQASEAEPLITLIEVGKPMLGPDTGSRPDHGRSEITKRSEPALPAELEAREQELINWLARIAMDWNGTNAAHLAVIDLNHNGKRDYIAAVLSEAMTDGTVIQHAVAAAPASRNKDDAVFLFRGEQGISINAERETEIWLTWREVFASIGQTKDGARLLGARKMLHTDNLDDRIFDMLTRHPDKIDDPRYYVESKR